MVLPAQSVQQIALARIPALRLVEIYFNPQVKRLVVVVGGDWWLRRNSETCVDS